MSASSRVLGGPIGPGLSIATRAHKLHDFYYEGLREAHIEPVVMAKHYGSAAPNASGQIRTNQFMAGLGPPDTDAATVPYVKGKATPVPVATNPPASLFDETINQPLGSSFRSEFLSQVRL